MYAYVWSWVFLRVLSHSSLLIRLKLDFNSEFNHKSVTLNSNDVLYIQYWRKYFFRCSSLSSLWSCKSTSVSLQATWKQKIQGDFSFSLLALVTRRVPRRHCTRVGFDRGCQWAFISHRKLTENHTPFSCHRKLISKLENSFIPIWLCSFKKSFYSNSFI